MEQQHNLKLGVLLMLGATLTFALQDGISRYLSERYNVISVVMIRYWFFALFVIAWSHWRGGGIATVARTEQLGLQIGRGLLLIAEICVAVWGFTLIGIINSTVIFAVYPLIVVALSAACLGVTVGWRRWAAVAVGFVGVVIALRPGSDVFSIAPLIPLTSAAMFAVYQVLTR